uniref:BTB domain-containing protein n=1 Tax=Mycena chlorophos TaxID=658473 RepID=A0ABQ0LU31_MYCCL|nr:predicted protein [Mycena chlorophos]
MRGENETTGSMLKLPPVRHDHKPLLSSALMDQSDDFTRVLALWFDDGTLVVRAQTTLFKVHSSVLSARSSVFRDMLAFPQDNDGGIEAFEGCPLVALPDEAEEVKSFLLAIYDSSYFISPPQPFDILSLLGILRLAHKYDVEDVFKRALRHFDGVLYFDNYQAFLEADSGAITSEGKTWNPMARSPDPRLLLAVVDSLTQVEAHWLLPVAQYCLASLPMHRLLNIPNDVLDGNRLRCILRQRQRLIAQRSRLLRSIIPWDGEDPWDDTECTTRGDCEAARVGFLIEESTLNDARMLDQLNAFTVTGLCRSCADGTFCKTMQDDLWDDELPGIFDLPDWEDLRAQRVVMFGS